MFDDLVRVFDSWFYGEDLSKAGPKGLSKWNKYTDVAERLNGKSKKDITFTCCHPDHPGEKHVLGSVQGNLHFLLGYCNPRFYLADYHWLVIDPSLGEEEAVNLFQERGHPARPEAWASTMTNDPGNEGDIEAGSPHPSSVPELEIENVKRLSSKGAREVRSGAHTYLALPAEGVLYCKETMVYYPWALVKDSFLSAANPEIAQKMEEAFKERSENVEETVHKSSEPEFLRALAVPGSFHMDVYPLIKSHFPTPGSVFCVEDKSGQDLYGVVSPSSITFYDRSASLVPLELYGRRYESLSLLKGGDVNPSILYSLAVSMFGVDHSVISNLAKASEAGHGLPQVVGAETQGFDFIDDSGPTSLERKVVRDGDTFRVVLGSSDV